MPALLLILACLAGCTPATGSGGPHSGASAATGDATGDVRRPRAHAAFDYQLGGPYRPAPDVRVVSRDRTAKPVPGLYNVCYVNAFQTQPGKETVRWWQRHHPELLLRKGGPDGDLVIDEDWDEPLLDISTGSRRAALAEVVGRWIDGCATAGFDAVEPDNLDSYQRSHGLLDADDAAAFARLLAARAHRQGLAIAQKNTTDLVGEHARIGFDFAVTEECGRYQECEQFATAYDNRVFDIEYRAQDLTAACKSWGSSLSLVLRDRDVRPKDESGYVHRHC
ncbi:endo alpha-1,4 polygalactosaminidase [Streptomyces pinistramenti]|uniref:endo alpha-1,4 polygalactosaminidase n=1 Tax=Streptomyces pinistramenti TaxID=2884812 RepID=UPI001D07BCEE|nr:endo alpha-1,4 polygalactosaminidase [Streptomyces pinistramenti]MCB5905951.1 endo alpha-1,4 polygalactosaminidase [Streptomyces pinistramenti]